MNTIALNISNIPVRQDTEGRYCLNDLHKASGGELKHRPGLWMENQQTKDLIAELEKDEAGIPASKISAISVLRGRGIQGTYAVKELVYAYAMWISPAFTLKVIHAYDSLVSVQYGLKQLPEPPTITKAQQGELFTVVNNKARSCSRTNAYFWSRFSNHFKVASYKELPAGKFDEAITYLRKLEGSDIDSFMMLTPKELSDIIRENIEAIKTGELMPKQPDNTFTIQIGKDSTLRNITLKFDVEDSSFERWFISKSDGSISVQPLDNELCLTFDKWIRYATQERGYLVIKKAEVLGKLQA